MQALHKEEKNLSDKELEKNELSSKKTDVTNNIINIDVMLRDLDQKLNNLDSLDDEKETLQRLIVIFESRLSEAKIKSSKCDDDLDIVEAEITTLLFKTGDLHREKVILETQLSRLESSGLRM